MRALLDDVVLDGETFELEVKSFKRGVIKRSAAGLDGQLSIDLGLQGRKLVQKGELRAKSEAELQRKIEEINELIDGQLHMLKCPDGNFFNNLLIEEFETDTVIKSGAHINCPYHITYTQQG